MRTGKIIITQAAIIDSRCISTGFPLDRKHSECRRHFCFRSRTQNVSNVNAQQRFHSFDSLLTHQNETSFNKFSPDHWRSCYYWERQWWVLQMDGFRRYYAYHLQDCPDWLCQTVDWNGHPQTDAQVYPSRSDCTEANLQVSVVRF